MPLPLSGIRVAILVDDGFEQIELTSPMAALAAAGADVDIVSPAAQTVRSWNHTDWGRLFSVTRTLLESNADEYDALVLPGGVISPDRLRRNADALEFVHGCCAAGKPVAAICHGPQLLIEADVVRGRQVTSFPSIRTDLQNAGATWMDEPLVVDRGLITSRSPADLADFNRGMIAEFAKCRHAAVAAARAR